MKNKQTAPMELQNFLEEEIKAEFQPRIGSPRRNAGSGQDGDKLPGRTGRICDNNPGRLEVFFKDEDKVEESFIIVLTLKSIPYELNKNHRGVKFVQGKIKPLFEIEENGKKKSVYRVPHHTEFIQDLKNGELIIKAHYNLMTNIQISYNTMEMDEDPKIIHPDEP